MRSTFIISVFFFLIIGSIKAQGQKGVFNQGGEIHVEAGGLLFVDGDVQNLQGLLVNEGNIRVTADWYNGGTVADSGTVVFLGSGPSHLSGNLANLDAFSRLELDKDSGAVSTQILMLNDDVEVRESIILTSGRIITGSASLILDNPAPNAISGYQIGATSDVRYIDGTFVRNVAYVDSEYVFPVGGNYTNGFRSNPLVVSFEHLDAPFHLQATFVDDSSTYSDTLWCQDGHLYPLICRYGEWEIQPYSPVDSVSYSVELYPNELYFCDSALFKVVSIGFSAWSDCPDGLIASDLTSFMGFSILSGNEKLETMNLAKGMPADPSLLLLIENPVSGNELRCTFQSMEHQSLELMLFDQFGREVESLWQSTVRPGQPYTLSYPVERLSPGVYLLCLKGRQELIHRRILLNP